MNAVQQPLSQDQVAALHSKLTEYDLYIVADGSGSMALPYKAGSSKTRWSYMQEAIQTMVHAMSTIDTDGIGMVVFNNGHIIQKDGLLEDAAMAMLNGITPNGGTPMGKALETVLGMSGSTDKKDLIVVFTDGEPDNQNSVIETLVKQANSQAKDNDCTVLFIQVGDDPDATAFLQMLDDDLQSKYGAKFDIVDVKTVIEMSQFGSMEEVLANAIID